MRKKGKNCLLFLLFALYFVIPASALEPGRGLPALRGEKYYSKAGNQKGKLRIVVLMDLTVPDALPLLRMLENMTLSSMGKDLSITVFAMNPEKTADEMMKRFGRFNFEIALDSSLKMRNLLAEKISLFPYALLAENGTVVWGGMPTELESIAEKVLAKKFSLRKQQKVEGLRKELQIAIQSGLPAVVSSTSDKILAVLPDDRLAIQAKLFALNAMYRKEEAARFIEKICIQNAGDVRLQMMQLDFLLREGKLDEFVKKVEERGRLLKGNKNLLLFVSFVLENAPFGVLMPQKTFALAHEAYKMTWQGKVKTSPLQKAVAAEGYARALSLLGRLEEAVKIQKQALKMRKGSEWEKDARRRLLYYQDALAGASAGKKK